MTSALIGGSSIRTLGSGAEVERGVCIVITTYEPARNLRGLITEAVRQASGVFLINDSGSTEVRKSLEAEFSGVAGLKMLHMQKNSGIAAALNCGLDTAKSRGFKKAVLLDDDTRIAPNLVKTLAHAWEVIERQGRRPGVIGVSRASSLDDLGNSGDGQRTPDWTVVRTVITAGSILNIEGTEQIGGFREEFIIDVVDYEFCARARHAGLLVAKLSESLIIQSVGSPKTVRLVGMNFSTTNHSPMRRYYMYRNNLIFAAEQASKDPFLSMAIAWFLIKTVFLVICFETQRARKVRAMFRGTVDGIRRRQGHARGSF